MGANVGGDAAVGAQVPADAGTSLDARILDATVRCVARWGVAKTTLDDIAREAGCSRASIYRTLPGGKQALLLAAAHREIGAALAVLDADLAECTDLRDVLLTLVQRGASFIVGNEALSYLVEHEPEVVLPHVSFDGLEPLLFRVAEFSSPHIGRFVDADVAWRTGEWMARIVTSYVFGDDVTLDLTDERQAARLVDTYVLPGLLPALRLDPGCAAEPPPVPAALLAT